MAFIPYKAIIVDLDRTLLRGDKTVSAYTLNVLRECREAGSYLYAATARPERAIAEYRSAIGFRAVTTLNGARIITPHAVFENPIREDSAALLLDRLCGGMADVISVEAESGIYANREIPLWNPVITEDLGMLPGREKIYKILVSGIRMTTEQMKASVPEDVYCTAANGVLIQFMSRRASKWIGIRRMLEEDRIGPDSAIFFGDDEDDIEPIRMCGCGVAVGNAPEHVKRMADAVADSNDEDGVARFLAGMMRS